MSSIEDRFLNAPEMAYKTLYGQVLHMQGRTNQPKKKWKGILVDKHLKDSWLETLNNIPEIDIRSTEEGKDHNRPAHIAFRMKNPSMDKLVPSIVKSINKMPNIIASYNIGPLGRPRIIVTYKVWYGMANWLQWWQTLPIKLKVALQTASQSGSKTFKKLADKNSLTMDVKPSSYAIAFSRQPKKFTIGMPVASGVAGYGIGKTIEKLTKRKGIGLAGALAGLTFGDVITDMKASNLESKVTPAEIKAVRKRLAKDKLIKNTILSQQAATVAQGVLPFGWVMSDVNSKKLSGKALAASEAGLALYKALTRSFILNKRVKNALDDYHKTRKKIKYMSVNKRRSQSKPKL